MQLDAYEEDLVSTQCSSCGRWDDGKGCLDWRNDSYHPVAGCAFHQEDRQII